MREVPASTGMTNLEGWIEEIPAFAGILMRNTYCLELKCSVIRDVK